MALNVYFTKPGQLDLDSHTVSQLSIPDYLKEAIEQPNREITEDFFVMMVGYEPTGEQKTLVF